MAQNASILDMTQIEIAIVLTVDSGNEACRQHFLKQAKSQRHSDPMLAPLQPLVVSPLAAFPFRRYVSARTSRAVGAIIREKAR
jgi:hypothetical protein